MRRAVIFDVDGVLVDSYEAHRASWETLAAETGTPWPEGAFAASFGQTSKDILLEYFGADLGAEELARLDERKEALYRRIVARDFPAMPGARSVVEALRGAGFSLAVGSSGPPENIELALSGLACGEHIDVRVTGRDVHRGKPDPEVFQIAAARLGVAPRHCAVIEDAPAGIEAARRAGMLAVAFLSTGRKAPDFVSSPPDHLVHSLEELQPERVRAWLDAHAARPGTP